MTIASNPATATNTSTTTDTATENVATEWSHDLARQAVYKLDEKVKARLGESAASILETRLGRSAGWWRSQKRNKSISFATLLAVLKEIGEDPRDLLEELIRECNVPAFEGPQRRFYPSPPPVATLAEEHFRRPHHPDLSLLEARMETLCRRNPPDGIAEITRCLPRIAISEIPLGLGLAATCYLDLSGLEEAYSCAQMAQDLAMELGDASLMGQMLLREAFIFFADGKPARATDNCRQALEIFAEERRFDMIGRALIDHGTCLVDAGKPGEALKKFLSSLNYIESVDCRTANTCYHGLAIALASSGREQEALTWLEKGLGDLPPEDELAGRLWWQKARILKQPEYYEKAIELLGEHAPMDAIRAGVDLAILLEKTSSHAGRDSLADTLLRVMPAVANRYDLMQAAIENVIALGKLERKSNYLETARCYLTQSWKQQLRSQLKKLSQT